MGQNFLNHVFQNKTPGITNLVQHLFLLVSPSHKKSKIHIRNSSLQHHIYSVSVSAYQVHAHTFQQVAILFKQHPEKLKTHRGLPPLKEYPCHSQVCQWAKTAGCTNSDSQEAHSLFLPPRSTETHFTKTRQSDLTHLQKGTSCTHTLTKPYLNTHVLPLPETKS